MTPICACSAIRTESMSSCASGTGRSHETYELTDDGVIISEKTANLLGVEKGDTVVIRGEEKGNKEVKIAQVCENYMGHYLYLTAGYYEKIYGDEPSITQFSSKFQNLTL